MTGPAPSERDLAVLRSFARRIDPSDAGAHNNLGVLYYQKGLVPEAIAAFTRALELDPKMEVAQANLAIAYQNSGYYDRRVAEREADSSVAQFYHGEALYNRGLNEPALEALDKAVRLNPDNADAHY